MSVYLTKEEAAQLDFLLGKTLDHSLSYWESTRIRGASGSMASQGAETLVLVKAFDRIRIQVQEKARGEQRELALDAHRYRKLIDHCGHLQDASDTVVTLSQDDATRTCLVTVGNGPGHQSFYGTSFAAAIDSMPEVDHG